MPIIIDPAIINGHRYSYASLAVRIAGVDYLGIRSINYSTALVPGLIYGGDPHLAGRTPGKAEHSCDFEVYRREWNQIMRELGQSFGRRSFDIQVQYAEDGDESVTTDKILGCRITNVEFPNEDGTDATTVAVTCNPMDILLGQDELSIDYVDRNRPAVASETAAEQALANLAGGG